MSYDILNSDKDTGGDFLDIHQVRFTVPDIHEYLQELHVIGTQCECSFICFNRHVIAGRKHVTAAVMHALRSFHSGNQIARSIEVESLLFAAGTRQTGLIGPFGIHNGFNECYLCIVPRNDNAEGKIRTLMEFADDENWEEISLEKVENLQKLFSITREELQVTGNNRLQDLILERVALLAVNR